MKRYEALTSIAALTTIPIILWLGTIDGLSMETMWVALASASGLGGYPILRDYWQAREG